MRRPQLRETMWATMKPDTYAGPSCDQIAPRWWCYADGDKDGDFQHEPLTLDARLFPPGTVVAIREPLCPNCSATRAPILPIPAVGAAFAARCRCGFDWDAWTRDEYS